ncbi:hypothetical protein [Streptomyces orinoci]|uniref:Uncharacterized protein n=1 Tax=Streptomyces orinoci TaxID=67339 RepID=A0ABV3K2R9_STRON|nr:hypothetical protein [Streptomyces orinoci]
MFTDLLHKFRAIELTRDAADYRLAEAARRAAGDTAANDTAPGRKGPSRSRASYRTAA